MILEIRLSNFYSIKEEIVLDLRAGNIKNQKSKLLDDNIFEYKDTKVLKTVAMYGANASGKSNIIKAINFCFRLIFESHLHNENTIYNYSRFKFEGFDKKPSTFFVRFVLNGIEHEYSFELNRNGIIKEDLDFYPKGRIKNIFSRDETIAGEKKLKYSFGDEIKRPLDVAENTSIKTLYISRASQMDREKGKEIFNFFFDAFRMTNINLNNLAISEFFKENKEFILKALQIADSDIVDIDMKKEKVPTKTLTTSLIDNIATVKDDISEITKITTFHKSEPNIPFDFETEESEGTKRLFFFIICTINIVRNNRFLIIDELDNSLHIRIVELIIKLFNASKSAQLIFTTHNTNLLDLNKTRKDQIYFVNKKEDASTELYSLFDYKDFRETMDLEKAYLQGRFDAVPFIDDSLPTLKALIYG